MPVDGAMEKAAAAPIYRRLMPTDPVAIPGRRGAHAVIDPFGAVDCGNDCDTIASQPEGQSIGTHLWAAAAGRAAGLTVFNVIPSRLSSRSWSSFDGAQLSPVPCRDLVASPRDYRRQRGGAARRLRGWPRFRRAPGAGDQGLRVRRNAAAQRGERGRRAAAL